MISFPPRPIESSKQLIQLLAGAAAAGFASPAADYYEPPISLDELLNIRAPHVWLVQVEGDSMRGAGIFHGTRLVVDRSLPACSGHVVLAYVDNQPLVKRLAKSPGGWVLESENPDYQTIYPNEYSEIEVFGVVTWHLTSHVL
ncbi:TPA: LexA family protein [Pseudomonas aeruginosa]